MSKIIEASTTCAKATITKDNLCDTYFDQLVIETSYRITLKLNTSIQQNTPSSYGNSSQETDESSLNAGESIVLTHNRLNQPKRPMNAFMVWGQIIRRELHQRFSNVQNAMLSKALGRVWKSLNNEEKEPYVKKAIRIKVIHKRNYPDYRYQPRRVQERRAKNNTLIGINLNHPVNQFPTRRNVFEMSDSSQRANFSQEYIPYRSCTKQNFRLEPSTMIGSQGSVTPEVQTIEYYPYTSAHQQQRLTSFHQNTQSTEFGQQQLVTFHPYQQHHQQSTNSNFINHNHHHSFIHHNEYQQTSTNQQSSTYESWCGTNNHNTAYLGQYNE